MPHEDQRSRLHPPAYAGLRLRQRRRKRRPADRGRGLGLLLCQGQAPLPGLRCEAFVRRATMLQTLVAQLRATG